MTSANYLLSALYSPDDVHTLPALLTGQPDTSEGPAGRETPASPGDGLLAVPSTVRLSYCWLSRFRSIFLCWRRCASIGTRLTSKMNGRSIGNVTAMWGSPNCAHMRNFEIDYGMKGPIKSARFPPKHGVSTGVAVLPLSDLILPYHLAFSCFPNILFPSLTFFFLPLALCIFPLFLSLFLASSLVEVKKRPAY